MNNEELISHKDDDQQDNLPQNEQPQKSEVSSVGGILPKNTVRPSDVQKAKSTISLDSAGSSREQNAAKPLDSAKDNDNQITDKSTNIQNNEPDASSNVFNKSNSTPGNDKEHFKCDLTQAANIIERLVKQLGGDCKSNFLDKSQNILNCPFLYIYFEKGVLSCSLHLKANDKLQVNKVEIIHRAGNRNIARSMHSLKKALYDLSNQILHKSGQSNTSSHN